MTYKCMSEPFLLFKNLRGKIIREPRKSVGVRKCIYTWGLEADPPRHLFTMEESTISLQVSVNLCILIIVCISQYVSTISKGTMINIIIQSMCKFFKLIICLLQLVSCNMFALATLSAYFFLSLPMSTPMKFSFLFIYQPFSGSSCQNILLNLSREKLPYKRSVITQYHHGCV